MTFGDHIRKRRLDLGLFRREVAAQLQVDVMSVVGWEAGDHEPLIRQIQKIIEFLGYIPGNLFPSSTLNQKITRSRLLHGMTRKQLAIQLGMDEATLRRLEAGTGKHSAGTLKKISDLIESST
ncbi:MAG: helix-turn-helix domain-containing protein [Bacteroidetes bacterium]|nr:helix-turn-helix domain-containing protein [Bacteroidota bacterium]